MSLPTNKCRGKGGNNTLKIIVDSASLAVSGKNNKNITRNALGPSFAKDQLSAAESPAVSLLGNSLVQSPRSDWDSLRITSCNSRPRINPEQNNPPNHHGPDISDRNEVFYIEAYISSFHPGDQLVLKVTPKTTIKLARKHRLNYSGYPTTSSNNWHQTELQLAVLYTQFHQVLVNFVYLIRGDVLGSIWKHVKTLI
ncbi:hypothetical protein BDV37DRAFT_269786 [Aspergillus pseudonomiae]|uniref:Uncharacterized protein n=1 Tax=Aspergillus pseudonomiae TaxID=1506151 RepID=A0A5N7DK78_9EURO|nr:uncharacterized protein BDV37DRAFT_269786 [Aspergillus pseudonomiae]KAE8406754.1 hypothetical protein BDV37DRAFT_269786 [Aspergillus pseudonomiae]